ncbi:hypothetical protein AC249_AIPGENE22404 [Exaiptasia diaphana]|nr:hypothetical protein AC249_AIPGENE22404 [Exaiptasia diaphana]
MGSPISVTVANLVMEIVESRALSTFVSAPKVFKRYVDDTICIIHKDHSIDDFHKCLNDQYKKIKFTIERYSDKGLPFLDTLNTVNQDVSIQVSMYRKKTHTDRYLHFDSHHPSKHKAAVVHTLAYRKESLLSDETSKRKEQEHLEKSLLKNGYPEKFIQRHSVIRKKDNGVKEGKDETKGFAVLPYVKGTTERVQRILQQHNIKCCIKPDKTLRQILSKPKDPVEYEKQSGVVYRIPCGFPHLDTVLVLRLDVDETVTFESLMRCIEESPKDSTSSSSELEAVKSQFYNLTSVLDKHKRAPVR